MKCIVIHAARTWVTWLAVFIVITVVLFTASRVFRSIAVQPESIGSKEDIVVIHPILWLSISVWAEAGGETYEGKLAVAFTHMNRAKDRRWPGTIEDVIFQSMQFSWTNPGDPNRMRLDNLDWKDPSFVESHKAASAAWYGLVDDPTHGANHYLNRKILRRVPPWYEASKVVAIIGNHEFLKL